MHHGHTTADPRTSSRRGTRAVPPLTEFEPKSMLHVDETHVARARFPVIDFHTHVSRRRRAEARRASGANW